MQARTSKALALLGGVATLALGSTFLLRSAPKVRSLSQACAPRLLELEGSVCEPLLVKPATRDQLAQFTLPVSN